MSEPNKTSFRDGFVIGWSECVGDKEPDKLKMRQIAEAAADQYLRSVHLAPSDWQWTPVSTLPYDGQLVLLRMMESVRQDVHYGIGWYSGEKREWVVTARPENDASLQIIAWVAVPK